MRLLLVQAAGFIGGSVGVDTCPDRLAGALGPRFLGVER